MSCQKLADLAQVTPFSLCPIQSNDYIIHLKFSGADTESALVKGKIKFQGSEKWTEEGRSREARDTPQEPTMIQEDSVRHVKIAAWHTLSHLLH